MYKITLTITFPTLWYSHAPCKILKLPFGLWNLNSFSQKFSDYIIRKYLLPDFKYTLLYFILFRCQNHKINENINKNKWTKIKYIKSHFINIIDTFTIKLKLKAYDLELLKHLKLFFGKNKRYSFIQIDRVHRYNTNPNSLKTKRMNLWTNSQHPC